MTNAYYTPGGNPAQSSSLTSANVRTELNAVQAGFDKLPTLTGNASKPVIVNAGETALGVGNSIGITLGTEQASTSGTAIDFTSIPSWVRRITVMFSNVSLSGTDIVVMQIGDAGGIETDASYAYVTSNSTSFIAQTTGTYWALHHTGNASNVINGAITLTLENASSNNWVMSGNLGCSQSGGFTDAGSKATSQTLDRLRITTSGGVNTFDAGAININYEG